MRFGLREQKVLAASTCPWEIEPGCWTTTQGSVSIDTDYVPLSWSLPFYPLCLLNSSIQIDRCVNGYIKYISHPFWPCLQHHNQILSSHRIYAFLFSVRKIEYPPRSRKNMAHIPSSQKAMPSLSVYKPNNWTWLLQGKAIPLTT